MSRQPKQHEHVDRLHKLQWGNRERSHISFTSAMENIYRFKSRAISFVSTGNSFLIDRYLLSTKIVWVPGARALVHTSFIYLNCGVYISIVNSILDCFDCCAWVCVCVYVSTFSFFLLFLWFVVFILKSCIQCLRPLSLVLTELYLARWRLNKNFPLDISSFFPFIHILLRSVRSVTELREILCLHYHYYVLNASSVLISVQTNRMDSFDTHYKSKTTIRICMEKFTGGEEEATAMHEEKHKM